MKLCPLCWPKQAQYDACFGQQRGLLPPVSCYVKYYFTFQFVLNVQLKMGTFPGAAPAGNKPPKTGTVPGKLGCAVTQHNCLLLAS